jgi:hypothetical protein
VKNTPIESGFLGKYDFDFVPFSVERVGDIA